jgi:uncharacterized protein YbjT (DUF2867 family)
MPKKPKKKTALVFGSTGLIGGIITELLLKDDNYHEVRVFSRRKIEIEHPKLKVVINDLEDPDKIAEEIMGDDLFCCLGTTMKKAGSKAAFEKVDLHLPVSVARIASENGVSKFLVVSSIGAGSSSMGFYLRTKGKMEEAVTSFPFRYIAVLRPSLLLGDRREVRKGEEVGKFLATVTMPLYRGPLKKYRPIQGATVAKAMIKLANSQKEGIDFFESDEIEKKTPKDLLLP